MCCRAALYMIADVTGQANGIGYAEVMCVTENFGRSHCHCSNHPFFVSVFQGA